MKVDADVSDLENDLVYTSRRVLKSVDMLKLSKEQKMEEGVADKELSIHLINELDQLMYKYKLSKDFMHYVALCAIFPANYNICKHWSKHEDIFIDLVGREGNIGMEHFLQALIVYFIRHMDKAFVKYAPTCMYNLWKEDVLSEKFILAFANKEIKLDKDSGLREKKCEKKFLEAIEPFIDFLNTAEAGESDYEDVDEKGEEVASPEHADEESKEALASLEAEKQKSLEERKLKQKELADKAKAQQQAAMDAAKRKQAEEDAEEQKRMEEAQIDTGETQEKVDIGAIAADDGEVDIDDI